MQEYLFLVGVLPFPGDSTNTNTCSTNYILMHHVKKGNEKIKKVKVCQKSKFVQNVFYLKKLFCAIQCLLVVVKTLVFVCKTFVTMMLKN